MHGPLASRSPKIRAPLGPIRTERLDLRRFDMDDVDALASVFAQEDVWRYPYGRAFSRLETEAFLEAQIAHWDAVGFGLWLTLERMTGRAVGYVGLSVPTFLPEILPAVEVGWRLDPSVWGRGYATEAASAALEEAFTTLGLNEVCSVPQADNPASVRVAERLGLRLDRLVDIDANERRGPVVGMLFVVKRHEWLAQRG